MHFLGDFLVLSLPAECGVCHSSSLWHHLLLELASLILVGPFQFRMLSFCDSRFQLAVSEAFSTQHTKAAEKHRVRMGMKWVPAAPSHMGRSHPVTTQPHRLLPLASSFPRGTRTSWNVFPPCAAIPEARHEAARARAKATCQVKLLWEWIGGIHAPGVKSPSLDCVATQKGPQEQP